MPRNSLVLMAALCLTLLSPAALRAASYDHWYQPHYMGSVEDASNRLQFLSPHFIPGNGSGDPVWQKSSFSLKNMSQSTLGINLIFTQIGVEERSDGLFTSTTTSVPFTKEAVSSIVYADIDYYMVEGLPAGASKFPWCIYPFSGHSMQNSVLCVPSESDAHQVVDALATLAVANGKDPGTDPGMWLLSALSKELRNHPERVCQAYFVEADGPAEQAGMQAGDIVHTVNGTTCSNEVVYAAVAAAAAKPSGGDVHLEILRKGRPLTVDLHYPNQDAAIAQLRQQSAASARHPVGSTVAIPDASLSAPPATAPTNPAQAAPSSAVHLGIHVRAVTDADMTAMGSAKAKGVVVTGVEKGSLAEEMQLQAGDVVVQVNGADFTDSDAFALLVRSGAVKTFRIWRKGQSLDVVVPQSM